ncbi:MAG: M55 family metallopeptidase [Armatimonadota bacterium]|nr:M55 family metallopeptidase [Armatimonadota bacterium]
MRVYMHWDMEGVSGLFTREQVWFWEAGVRPEVAEEGRQLLVADINSAVAAALRAGAEHVFVCDTHHGGGNIRLPEMLADPRVTYHVKSRAPVPGGMRWMPDLEHADGLMLMGHHAKAGTEGAFLPHTWTLEWADFRINGESVGEMGIEACFAGHWGVPTLLAHGDTACAREAAAFFPGVVTAAVKEAIDPERCTGPDPASARQITAEQVVRAIEAARTTRPPAYQPTLPALVTVRMRSPEAAEAAARNPGVRRVDDCTVERVVNRRCDVVQWIARAGLE